MSYKDEMKRQHSMFVDEFVEEDEGSLTIFSLFLFILILFISGMAVDLMRYENERVAVQNAIDTAIVAASSLNQNADTDAEITTLVKEYVAKAGYDPDIVSVTPDVEFIGSIQTSRSVSASVDFRMDTMFMNMMGVDSLVGYADSAAAEGQQLLEIALVLDISGSMGDNSKLENMKSAAKEFITTMITNNGQDRVSISIIPYNHQVHMDADLMSRLNIADETVTVNVPPNSPPGMITSYQTRNPAAPCARFLDADFETRRLSDATDLEPSGSFVDNYFYFNLNGVTNTPYAQPNDFTYWCGSFYPPVMLYQNDATTLHDYIDTFIADGGTAIDYGMNWAVGVLDPSFAPVVAGMVTDGLAPATAAGHPVPYSNTDVLKYVVLMTDGQNTNHRDLKDAYKSGPSPVWYSPTLANGNEFNGFVVEMNGGPPAERWYVPGSPTDVSDDYYMDQASLPSDLLQWDFHQLYQRFARFDVANYFFQHSNDAAAYADFLDPLVDPGSFTVADDNLKNICDEAKLNDQIEVFTVAFEAPANGVTVLQDCASKAGNFFDVDGTQISVAFSSIAAQISQLRLTE